ncbi:MAG: hypothetical protein ABEI11_01895 [Haloarculaceae archaeon]
MNAPERDRGGFDPRPSRLGTGIAAAAGLFAVAALSVLPAAAAIAAAGLLALFAGGRGGDDRLVAGGLVGVAAGLLVAGALGAPAELLVVATVAGFLAWDAAENAVSVGAQLGAAASTARAELAHVGATVLVATGGGGVAYAASRLTDAPRPIAAAILLLLAVVLLGRAFD